MFSICCTLTVPMDCSGTLITTFHKLSTSNPLYCTSLRWSHGWRKHVTVHKGISVYLSTSVHTITLYIHNNNNFIRNMLLPTCQQFSFLVIKCLQMCVPFTLRLHFLACSLSCNDNQRRVILFWPPTNSVVQFCRSDSRWSVISTPEWNRLAEG